MMYRERENCGASLDPGEICDCRTEEAQLPAILCVQKPVIVENLDSVRNRLDGLISEVRGLPQDNESLKKVKKLRADLNKEKERYEAQRKEARRIVLAPYERANKKYEEYISGPYSSADQTLKEWVDNYQNGIKQKCEDDLREYFYELRSANHVEWLPYERCGVVVDLASAKQKTPKKLREQLAQFVARVASDVDRIAEMDDSEEIMVEYQKSLNVADSIGIVLERHRRIQAQREAAQAREAAKTADAAAIQKVEAVAPPVAVPPPQKEKRYKIAFTLHPTEAQMEKLRPVLRGLKDFLAQEGILYE